MNKKLDIFSYCIDTEILSTALAIGYQNNYVKVDTWHNDSDNQMCSEAMRFLTNLPFSQATSLLIASFVLESAHRWEKGCHILHFVAIIVLFSYEKANVFRTIWLSEFSPDTKSHGHV